MPVACFHEALHALLCYATATDTLHSDVSLLNFSILRLYPPTTITHTQGHRQEVIGALAEVVRQMLLEFYHRNGGKKPEAIIYYRDGVADSQFPTVLEHEYKAFRQVGGGPSDKGLGVGGGHIVLFWWSVKLCEDSQTY